MKIYTKDYLRDKISGLSKKNPYIHIDISLTIPHIKIENERVKLIGVCPHIFRIEEGEHNRCHSLKYEDLIAKFVKIAELA